MIYNDCKHECNINHPGMFSCKGKEHKAAERVGKEEMPNVEKPKDVINNPSHYTNGKIECIDAIEVATESLNGIQAVCTGNVIKYIWRWKLKNGIEDLKKARWYLDKLISELE